MAEIVRSEQRLEPFKAATQLHWRQLQALLPKGMDAKRFLTVAMLAVQKNPDLQECSPQSFALAVLYAGSLGLEVGTEAYLVPYAKKVQCQPGYQGLVKLALQSGMVSDIWADVVREGDTFKVARGTKREIVHTRKGKLGAAIVAAYACSKDARGNVSFTVLDADQIQKRRDVSKAKNGSAWTEWPEEMAMAKAIRAHMKLLPKSSEVNAALLLHEAAELGKAVPTEAILPDIHIDTEGGDNGDAA